ncbi:DNA polymerase III subunit beta [Ralstonia phage UAM5]|nr:DNA polymerase III subunit beta [Ralstonia phage UAM5]
MISFDTKDFERALSTVSRVIKRSTTLPVLSMVRVQSDEAGARLIATNMDAQVTVEIEPQGKKLDIDLCIPVDRLQAAMKIAGPTITIKDGKGKANIKTGNSNLNPPSVPGDTMPLMAVDGDALVEFKSDWLAGAIERVDCFAPDQDVRHHLNGVFIESACDELFAVATNGYVLAAMCTGAKVPEFEAIIPKAHVGMLVKLGPATYAVYENFIAARADGVEIVAKLINAKYVVWRRVVHDGGKNAVTLDRAQLLSAASVAASFSDTTNKKINPSLRLDGNDGDVIISNVGNDEFQMAVPATDPKGSPLYAGLNAVYLSNALKQTSGEKVTLKWQDGLASFLITEGEFTAIIMPLKI